MTNSGFDVYLSDRGITKTLHLENAYGNDIAESFIKGVANNGIAADGSMTAEKYNMWVDILDAIPAVVNAAIESGHSDIAEALTDGEKMVKILEEYDNDPA
jgi:hypothetical protein